MCMSDGAPGVPKVLCLDHAPLSSHATPAALRAEAACHQTAAWVPMAYYHSSTLGSLSQAGVLLGLTLEEPASFMVREGVGDGVLAAVQAVQHLLQAAVLLHQRHSPCGADACSGDCSAARNGPSLSGSWCWGECTVREQIRCSTRAGANGPGQARPAKWRGSTARRP